MSVTSFSDTLYLVIYTFHPYSEIQVIIHLSATPCIGIFIDKPHDLKLKHSKIVSTIFESYPNLVFNTLDNTLATSIYLLFAEHICVILQAIPRDVRWEEIYSLPNRTDIMLVPSYAGNLLGNSIKLLYYHPPLVSIQVCPEQLSITGQSGEGELTQIYPHYNDYLNNYFNILRLFEVTSTKITVKLCSKRWQLAFALNVSRLNCKHEKTTWHSKLKSLLNDQKQIYNWCRYIFTSNNAVVKLDPLDDIKVSPIGNCSSSKITLEIYDAATVIRYIHMKWELVENEISYQARYDIAYLIVSKQSRTQENCHILIRRNPPLLQADWSEIKDMLNADSEKRLEQILNSPVFYIDKYVHPFAADVVEYISYVSKHLHTWEYASKYCRDWGGTLLTIQSVDQMDTIRDRVQSSHRTSSYLMTAIYIGLKEEVKGLYAILLGFIEYIHKSYTCIIFRCTI